MQVTVNIRKRDVIWLSMQVFCRSSLSRWVTLLLLLLNAVVFYRKGYSGLESMLFGTIMSIFCMALGWLVQTIVVLYQSRRSQGILGQHDYRIVAEGLIERTAVNEDLLAWQEIHQLHQTQHYILVYINPIQCHMLPRRDFAQQADYTAFYTALSRQGLK